MVAGGVLGDSKNHLDEMGDLSLEILRAAKEAGVQMRIGLHSGPLVAGVIGKKKFLYDLWGETVNLSSRLESHGVAGQVQVTQGVADTMPDFRFKRRGEVDFKGVGLVETCFLVGRKGDD